jgi:hypothetical protein
MVANEINGNSVSRISASFPKTRTKPFGTTVLYSNQKSKRPIENSLHLPSPRQAKRQIFFSEELNSAVGAPKC